MKISLKFLLQFQVAKPNYRFVCMVCEINVVAVPRAGDVIWVRGFEECGFVVEDCEWHRDGDVFCPVVYSQFVYENAETFESDVKDLLELGWSQELRVN